MTLHIQTLDEAKKLLAKAAWRIVAFGAIAFGFAQLFSSTFPALWAIALFIVIFGAMLGYYRRPWMGVVALLETADLFWNLMNGNSFGIATQIGIGALGLLVLWFLAMLLPAARFVDKDRKKNEKKVTDLPTIEGAKDQRYFRYVLWTSYAVLAISAIHSFVILTK